MQLTEEELQERRDFEKRRIAHRRLIETRKTVEFTALHKKYDTERSTALKIFAALSLSVT